MSANQRRHVAVVNGRSASPDFSDSDNESLPDIECKICDRSFPCVSSYQQHLKGRKHYNQIVKGKISAKAAIDNLAEEHPGSDDDEKLNSEYTELFCNVCSKTFSGYKPYASHLHGSVHAKNMKKMALKEKMKDVPGVEHDDGSHGEGSDDGLMPKVLARCSLCEKEFTSLESFQKHLAGSMHKKNLQKEKIIQKIKDEHKGSDGEIEDDFFRKCEICDKEFSGLQPYHVHMQSLVHKKALKRIEMEEKIKDLCSKDLKENTFICKECNKPFTDPFSFKAHLDNNSHKKYEAKAKIMELVQSYPEIVAAKTIQNVPADSDEIDEYQIGGFILLCKLCHTSFSGPQSAIAHVKSKKHVKTKLEKATLKQLKQNLKDSDNKAKRKTENGDSSTKKPEEEFELL